MMPWIRDSRTAELIDPTLLFAKEANTLLGACHKVYEGWLHQYKGCYLPNYPKSVTSMSAYIKWLKENPDEQEKIKASRAEWKREYDRQFRIIFGIAKRHGLYLKQREYYVEQWLVYRDHEVVAVIHCA